MLPPGSSVVMSALTQPRLQAGMNSCTSGRSIVKMPAFPTPKEAEEHQEKPSRDEAVRSRRENHDAGRERDGDRRQYEHRAAADLVAEPPPEEGARNRAEAGGKQDSPALPIGQRPLLGQRRSDVSDQKEIKEIEQICQVRRADWPPLICRQLLLAFQEFDHDISLRWPADGEMNAARRSLLLCVTDDYA